MNVTNNGKFALLLLLKETSPAVKCSFSMWVHSINKDRKTHGEYVIIFIGMLYLLEYAIFIGIGYIYWNMLSYILEYAIIYIGICLYLLEFVIFIICYHIYWNMSSYLLENVITIGICYHINLNMLPYLLEYVIYIIFLRICYLFIVK